MDVERHFQTYFCYKLSVLLVELSTKRPDLKKLNKMYHVNLDQHTALLTRVELTTLVMKGTACMHTVSHEPFFQNVVLIFICTFLAILHWKLNTILRHKVNNPCFMFSLNNWNEWICSWLYLQRFNIAWLPYLFLMGRRIVYLASLILPPHLKKTSYSYNSEVCLWVKISFQSLFTYGYQQSIIKNVYK